METMQKKEISLEQRQPELLELFARSSEQGRLGHAYLFEGPRGTGKKDMARWIARSIFCEQPVAGKACGNCRNCRRMAAGDLPDLMEVEPDGQSIKVDQVRDLKAEFSKSAVEGSKKVYILDEAEKMTVSAANSLLTFLEEPGTGTYLFLLTTVKENILPTIRSRCQIIHFQPLQRKVMEELLLAEGIKQKDAEILSAVTNDLAEAKELAQDEVFHVLCEKTWRWFQLLMAHDPMAFLYIQMNLLEQIKDKAQALFCLDLLLFHYRDLLYLTFKNEAAIIHQHLLEEYRKITKDKRDSLHLTRLIEAVLQGKQALAANVQLQGVLENIAIKSLEE